MKNIKLVSFLVMSFCFTSYSLADNPSSYQKAIISSSLHTTNTPVNPLTVIHGSTVRMVVYTTYDGYKTSDTAAGANIWTTVAPEVKQRCTQYIKQNKNIPSHEELTLWIAQLLGLPADNADKRRFVELDVPVVQAYYGSTANIGIFRPCTDPRISAHPDNSPACPAQMDSNDQNISSDYKTWFINNSINAHTLTKGAPWTEYGYTYNWNENASDRFGASEFVVLKGTPVTVLPNENDPSTAYISAEEYCGAEK